MNIEKLCLYNFRIYNGKKEFDFKKKRLVIFLGPNGAGKSAIYDAIEWVITGNISRYSDSKESNFNFIVNNRRYNTGKYETYVEIVFDNGMKIRRSVEKKQGINTREVKRVIINGKVLTWSKGTSEIYSKITGDNTLEGLDRFTKTFKPSTILSQDEISNFVLSDNPEERLKLFMDILSLEGFGVDFKKDISLNKKTYKDKYQEVNNKMSDLQHNKEELLGYLKQKQIELKYEQSIEDSKNVYSKSELIKIINRLLFENKQIIQKEVIIDDINNETIDNLNKVIDDIILNKESLEKEIITINSYIKESEVSHDNMKLEEKNLNNIIIKKKESKNKIECLNKDLLKEKLDVKDISSKLEKYKVEVEKIIKDKQIKTELENEINNLYRNLNEQGFKSIEIFEKEKKEILSKENILQNMIECKNIYNLIEQLKLSKYEKEQLFNQNSKSIGDILLKLDKIDKDLNDLYKKSDNQQQSEIDKIIYTIQEEIIKDNRSVCLVCGSSFGDNQKITKAIEILRSAKEIEEKSYSRNILDLENVKKEYRFLLEDMNKKSKELTDTLNNITNNILINEQKYNSLVFNLPGLDLNTNTEVIESELKLIINKKMNYLKLDLAVDKLKKLNLKFKNIKKDIEYSEIKKDNLLEEIRSRYTKLVNEYKLTNDYLKINLLPINILEMNNILTKIDMELGNHIEKCREKIEILEIELDNTQAKLQDLRSKILIMENATETCMKILKKYNVSNFEEFIVKSEDIILNINIVINKLKDNIRLIKATISNDKIITINEGIDKINEEIVYVNGYLRGLEVERSELVNKLQMLEELNNKLPHIMSDLLAEFLKISNKEINKNFVQVSPYISNKYINIVSREGGLYILLTDSEEYDNLVEMNKKEFEKQVNASMTLSSAQSNILALSVFLTSNKINIINNFDIIGLDDPFQNMDDINIYSLIDILCDLMKYKQLLVSTHDHSFVNLLVSKSGLRIDEIEIVEYITYDENGVYILGDELEF